MKLLEASYGHDSPSKVWLSLRTLYGPIDPVAAMAALQVYGCHETFARKAVTVLNLSGRYDCCVQRGWIRNLSNVFEIDMRAVGISPFYDPMYAPPW